MHWNHLSFIASRSEHHYDTTFHISYYICNNNNVCLLGKTATKCQDRGKWKHQCWQRRRDSRYDCLQWASWGIRATGFSKRSCSPGNLPRTWSWHASTACKHWWKLYCEKVQSIIFLWSKGSGFVGLFWWSL